jgi:hypothetical protein
MVCTSSTCRRARVDQLRLVAAADDEMLGARAEQASSCLSPHAAVVVLRVDRRDAAGTDRDVVDVRARARNAPVV